MNVYLKNAGPTLMGLISKASDRVADRHNLDDEIDLARAVAIQATDMLTITLEAPQAKENHKLIAAKIVQDAIDHVTRTVTASAKIKLLEEGAVELKTVQWVVAEVARAIDETVRQVQPELAEQLIKRIANIKLPVDGKLEAFIGNTSDEQFL